MFFVFGSIKTNGKGETRRRVVSVNVLLRSVECAVDGQSKQTFKTNVSHTIGESFVVID